MSKKPVRKMGIKVEKKPTFLRQTCINIMIQLAYKYSCNWRYQFNYGETGVVVFDECAVTHSKNMKVRQWKVGLWIF